MLVYPYISVLTLDLGYQSNWSKSKFSSSIFISSILTERNHWAYLKQKKIVAIDWFSQPELILEGLCCFGKSRVCGLSRVSRKKIFWCVDNFVLSDISGCQIILWFSQIFIKDASRNTRIRRFVINFSCKRKFWFWLFDSLIKEIIIPSSFLIFLIQYGVQPSYCFLYFFESILKTEYFFTGLDSWLKTWASWRSLPRIAYLTLGKNCSVFVSYLYSRNNTMCCHHEYLQRYVRREFQNAAIRVINNI